MAGRPTNCRGESGHGLLAAWCRCWEQRIEAVDNYQDQMVVRSLFLRSATRLKALHRASTLFGDGFMLSDLEDWEVTDPDFHDKVATATITLERLPELGTYVNSKVRFLRLIEEEADRAVQDLTEQFFAQQVVRLCRFLRHSPFSDSWITRFKFEAFCIEAICDGIPGSALTRDEVAFWRSHRAELLTTTTNGLLELRN